MRYICGINLLLIFCIFLTLYQFLFLNFIAWPRKYMIVTHKLLRCKTPRRQIRQKASVEIITLSNSKLILLFISSFSKFFSFIFVWMKILMSFTQIQSRISITKKFVKSRVKKILFILYKFRAYLDKMNAMLNGDLISMKCVIFTTINDWLVQHNLTRY